MTERTREEILAAFIRSQAALTDKHPHTPGPGSVNLNNEEALLCAEALEILAWLEMQTGQLALNTSLPGDMTFGWYSSTTTLRANNLRGLLEAARGVTGG
jgi:hypothetical protein